MSSSQQPLRLLFVCTANSERSPTAVDLFRKSRRFEVASAGIQPTARRVVRQDHVDWADIIFVMSEHGEGHATILERSFDLSGTRVVNLEIQEKYPRGSPNLVNLLRKRMSRYIDLDI